MPKTKNTYKPALLLAAAATVMPELLSGNTPLSHFFHGLTIPFLALFYGVAVLLVREFAVRHRLSYAGIFILGFAYAILNEGLLAKTLIARDHVPVGSFNHYGYAWGINFSWAAFIMLWHAVCSVLFPILAAHTFFPEESEKPWLKKKTAGVLIVIIMTIGSLVFLGHHKRAGHPDHLLAFLAAMLALAWLARRFRQTGPSVPQKALTAGPVGLGVSTILFIFILLPVLAKTKCPLLLFFTVYAAGIWFYIRVLTGRSWTDRTNLFLFATGCYIQTTFGSMVAALHMPATRVERIATAIVAEIVLIVVARVMIRRSTPGTAKAPL